MRKEIIIITLIGVISLSGCASQADKEAAAAVDQKIASISEVTLDNISIVNSVEAEFEALSDKQKQLVSRKDDLQQLVSNAEKIIIENDPSNKIDKSDMSGVWRETVADSHRGFFYFKDNGSIYYMANKEDDIAISDFTSNYLIASSYELDGYDTNQMGKTGNFYNSDLNRTYDFIVKVDDDGQMTMDITGSPVEGIYEKQESISNSRTEIKMCIVDGCPNEAVYSLEGLNGAYEYYCEEHYQEMKDILEMMENDVANSSSSSSSTTEGNSYSSSNLSPTSYDATLEYGSGSVLICASEDAMSRYMTALNNGYQGTIDEMTGNGEIAWTSKGTKCNIVDRKITKCQVKLLDGIYAGNTVWVVIESLKEAK